MTLPIPAGTYGIDPAHSQLDFSITHLGISLIRGRFPDVDGSLTVGDDLAGTSVAVEAQIASISTGNEMRDGHVQGDDFFDTANHPTLSFESTAIAESGDGYTLTGDLTIKGVTAPVTLAVDFNGSGVFPMDGSTRFGFAGTGTINRSAFGIDYGIPMVSDEVALSLQAQFVSPAAE